MCRSSLEHHAQALSRERQLRLYHMLTRSQGTVTITFTVFALCSRYGSKRFTNINCSGVDAVIIPIL